MNRDVVLFDMGDTLIHGGRQERLAVRCGVEPRAVALALQRVNRWFMRREREAWQRGGHGYDRRWAALLIEHLGAAVEVDDILDLARDTEADWRLYPETLPVLAQLRRRGITCALLSNWSLRGRPLAERLGLAAHLDAMVFSAETPWEKPAAEIFAYTLARLGVDPQRAVYVGDNYWDDVVGARRAGVLPLLIDRVGALPHPGDGDCPLLPDLHGVLAWVAPRGTPARALALQR